MCNDRNSPKVRSLANYCFDLRFYKPRVEQIKVRIVHSNLREVQMKIIIRNIKRKSLRYNMYSKVKPCHVFKACVR